MYLTYKWVLNFGQIFERKNVHSAFRQIGLHTEIYGMLESRFNFENNREYFIIFYFELHYFNIKKR